MKCDHFPGKRSHFVFCDRSQVAGRRAHFRLGRFLAYYPRVQEVPSICPPVQRRIICSSKCFVLYCETVVLLYFSKLHHIHVVIAWMKKLIALVEFQYSSDVIHLI